MVGSFLYFDADTFDFEGDVSPCLAVFALIFVVIVTIIFANTYRVYLLLLSFMTK